MYSDVHKKYLGGCSMFATQTPIAGAQGQVTSNNLVTEDFSFLSEMAGEGLEDIKATSMSIAYLSMVQPDSSYIDEENKEGTWRNSATGRNYGNTVRVIPIAFRTIWNERENEAPYRNVGRYPVGGIQVEVRQPPKGKRGFPTMINPETGNKVQELFVYAVVLPDFPEDGVLFFNPTVGSMKTAKAWNSQLKGQLLPNGVQAPIFGYAWNLVAELTPNPQQPSRLMARFSKAIRDTLVSKELFDDHVKPQLESTKQNVLSLTESTDDAMGADEQY